MATPRRPDNPEESQNKFKAPAPKSSDAIFAKPRSMRKPNAFKKNFKKKSNEDNDEEDEEEEEEKTNYRNRAAERRKQGDNPTDESQLSTEELLQRTQAEAGEELMLSSLDFALLRKVRTDLDKKKKNDSEDEEESDEEEETDTKEIQSMNIDPSQEQDLDDVLDKFERGERVKDDVNLAVVEETEEEQADKPKFRTLMAKNIFEQIDKQNSDEKPRVELFEPGRMAFVFELADEVGHYSDAFAIPTAVIRSKADVSAKLSKSGWSEDIQAETNLVIEKIAQVMEGVRRGDRHQGSMVEKVLQKPIGTKATTMITSQPIAVVEDAFMAEEKDAADNNKNYFQGLVDEDEEMPDASNDAVDALLSKATATTSPGRSNDTNEDALDKDGREQQGESAKKRKYNVELDADAADIDMFGLSSSALPTSFEEHQSTAYESGDEDEEGNNQGTSRNKKAQMTRWDFDTEEEWHNYKSSIEFNPKSAFQFGVKLGDGRKRNRERKGMNDKQRLDRDYQQVKNIMSKKYGKSLDN
ncbi:unnamed protein product [Mucor hiemalis]